MSEEYVLVNKSDLTALADAIREKTGTSNPLALSEFANMILQVSSESDANSSTD